jgi:hypothetical protein
MAAVAKNVRALLNVHSSVLRRSLCRFSAVAFVHNRHEAKSICCSKFQKLTPKVNV